MIIHKIDDTTELVYTDNRTIDFNFVISAINYSDGGGSINSNVDVSHAHSYSPEGYTKSVVTTKLEKGDKTTYILDNTISFNYRDVSSLLGEFKYFGKKAVLNFKGNQFGGNLSRHKDSSIRNNDGKVITFKQSSISPDSVKGIHNFIHRMKMDNGQMLIPIIKRYLNTVMLLKGAKHLLTGYANLEDYLNFIKSPSRDILNSFTETISDADFVIEINPSSPEVRMKAVGVKDDHLIVDLIVDGKIDSVDDTESLKPYVILNTKPIKLLNQTLPYFISRQKNIPIFITPLMLKSTEMLTNLKGGINLLK